MREKMEQLIKQEINNQKSKMEIKLNKDEQIFLVPVRFRFSSNGFLDHISVLNSKPYFNVNKIAQKDYCIHCGKAVDDEHFVTNSKDQKIHVQCFLEMQTAPERK